MNKIFAFGLAAAIAVTSTSAFAADGEKLFKRKCGTCHTMEEDRIGPHLAGTIGRKAGSTTFKKYKALKDADFTWDEEHLDAWIADSKKYAKENLGGNTAMMVKIPKEEDRKAIIEYMKAH